MKESIKPLIWTTVLVMSVAILRIQYGEMACLLSAVSILATAVLTIILQLQSVKGDSNAD